MTNVAPGFGGVERDPMTIHAHTQPGAADVELLQNTVSMTLSAQQIVDRIAVTVAITNTGAGHHVPTDHPARHMLLVVTATERQGQVLPLQRGSTVPGWGGEYAGQPGEVYAKVLRDVATGKSPVVSYWKQTLIESDNRIAALAADTSTYEFAVPQAGAPITVTVTLIFRRAFKSLMEQKGWQTPDIIMEEETLSLTATPVYRIYLPLVVRNVSAP